MKPHPDQRWWEWLGAVSLRTKIMGIVLGSVLLLGLVISWWVRDSFSTALSQELERRGLSIARDLADGSAELILTGRSFTLHELMTQTVTNNADVHYIILLNPGGGLLMHSLPRPPSSELLAANPLLPGQPWGMALLDTEEGIIRDLALPILDGKAGVVRVGLSETRIRNEVEATVFRVMTTTGGVLLLGLGAAFLLTLVITRPIRELVLATQAVSRGELGARAPVRARDEVGTLASAFNTMAEELQRKEELRAQLLDKVISAQEEERQRIARELHDETGQALTSLMVGLHLAEQAGPSLELTQRLGDLRALAAQTLDEVRRLSLELRPGSLDDLGLVPTLEQYVRQFAQQHGIAIAFQALGLDGKRLPPPVELVLYRTIQEALTNVARHAQAQHASVLLDRRPDGVVVLVDDDGVGFDVVSALQATDGPSLGLHGMQERAALVGGKLTIESSPGSGTTLYLQIPLPQEVLS